MTNTTRILPSFALLCLLFLSVAPSSSGNGPPESFARDTAAAASSSSSSIRTQSSGSSLRRQRRSRAPPTFSDDVLLLLPIPIGSTDDATNTTNNATDAPTDDATNATTASLAPTPAVAPTPPAPNPSPSKKPYHPSPDGGEEEEEKKKKPSVGVIFGWIAFAFSSIFALCYFRDAIFFFLASAWNNTRRFGCRGCLGSFFPCVFGSQLGSGAGVGEPLDQIIFESEDPNAPLMS